MKTVANNLTKVKNIIAVASGKGGVGKSTVAVSVATVLSKKGYKTGLLDADIYGPSIPELMSILKKPIVENNRIIPVERDGIKIMSIGLMLEESLAVIWRGPMMSKAIKQFIEDVEWGELDYLIVDLPPGTGDASLTIAQSISLSGVLIVTTPQEAASKIAAKAASMFKELKVPIFGIVENMSYFKCQGCGRETSIFAKGGSDNLSKKTGLEILAKIPISAPYTERGIFNDYIEDEKIAGELEKLIKKITKEGCAEK